MSDCGLLVPTESRHNRAFLYLAEYNPAFSGGRFEPLSLRVARGTIVLCANSVIGDKRIRLTPDTLSHEGNERGGTEIADRALLRTIPCVLMASNQ
jgi:hypothetical protein